MFWSKSAFCFTSLLLVPNLITDLVECKRAVRDQQENAPLELVAPTDFREVDHEPTVFLDRIEDMLLLNITQRDTKARTLQTTWCGNGKVGNGTCSNWQCCSEFGWCGTTSAHCTGTCGNGNRGNGRCSNGECCSQYGWCGKSSAHCSSSPVAPPVSPPVAPPVTPPVAPPPTGRALNITHIQAGLNRYNTLQGGSAKATQDMVTKINAITSKYSLYRKVALVAHMIWESGGFKFTEEIAAVTPPFTNKDKYQVCDWSTGQLATNGKFFYGRGYLQLSWCANYKAYGKARMINKDPDFFYNNPETVATTYAFDSAAWFFEVNVPDNTGRFGATTKSINGPIECIPANNVVGSIPQKRWQIFKAIASKVGLTGYVENGCYN